MHAFPTLRTFSEGYYLVEDLFIETSSDSTVPKVHEYFYEVLQDEYYQDEQTPILFHHMRTQSYFGTRPVDDVPLDVIELPVDMADELNLDVEEGGYSEEQMLLTKPGHAQRIYSLSRLAERHAK